MASKSVPLSVRISDDDADFLARLPVAGAVTPSDKIRAIIQESRRRHTGGDDYAQCLALLQDLAGPATRRVREGNHREGRHSELLTRLAEWLPEAAAYFMADPRPAKGKSADLEALEAGMADRVVALLEAFLRMGVTSEAPCYDKAAVARRIKPILELAHIIKEHTTK